MPALVLTRLTKATFFCSTCPHLNTAEATLGMVPLRPPAFRPPLSECGVETHSRHPPFCRLPALPPPPPPCPPFTPMANCRARGQGGPHAPGSLRMGCPSEGLGPGPIMAFDIPITAALQVFIHCIFPQPSGETPAAVFHPIERRVAVTKVANFFHSFPEFFIFYSLFYIENIISYDIITHIINI